MCACVVCTCVQACVCVCVCACMCVTCYVASCLKVSVTVVCWHCRSFSPSGPCEGIHTRKSKSVLFEAEPDIWMALVCGGGHVHVGVGVGWVSCVSMSVVCLSRR